MTNTKKPLARLAAAILLAVLAVTGAVTSDNQRDRAPSAGDPKPHCC